MFLDPRERTVAIGVWITSYSVGAAIGPLLGGVLLEYFWWGSVFLLAVPVMVLLLVLGPMLLPEYRDPNAGRLDLPSAALSLAAVLAVIYGLKQIAAGRLRLAAAACVLSAGVALGVVFVRRQRTLADPLIDLRAVPRAGVQRGARDLHARLLRRRSASSSSSRSTCSSCSACRRSRPGCGRCRWRSASSSARC